MSFATFSYFRRFSSTWMTYILEWRLYSSADLHIGMKAILQCFWCPTDAPSKLHPKTSIGTEKMPSLKVRIAFHPPFHFGDRYSSTNNQAIFWSKTTGPGDQLDEWNNLSSTSTYLKSGHFTFEYGPHLSCTKPNSLRWNPLPTSPPNLVTHLAHALPRLLKTLMDDVNSSNGQALGESWWHSLKENRWKHSFNGGSLLRFNLNTCWKIGTCWHLFLTCLKSNNNLNGSQEPTGVWNSQLGGPLIRSVCFKNPTRPQATIEKYLGRKPKNCQTLTKGVIENLMNTTWKH